MPSLPAIAFGPFVVDIDAEQLLRDGSPVPLRPKTWAVLRHLVERPGQLVTKEELLERLWPDVTVSDSLPGVSVAELRTVLGDDPREPRFIATVHRRGYRFVATASRVATTAAAARSAAVVGREEELGRLRTALVRAAGGERQLVLVSGEAGIGKTTLVETFLAETLLPKGTRVARGECLEHFGPGEPFLPVTDAFKRLCAAPDGGAVVDAFRRCAPLWLPWLAPVLGPEEQEAVSREARVATPGRMIGTFADALDAASANAPLVLVLEDLHWSDASTVDLLTRLALRVEPACLLAIGTYRPVELLVRRHPLLALRQQLQRRQRSLEVRLDFLGQAPTEAFLAARFPGATLPDGLAAWLLRRTEGNPLFMTRVADALEAQGVARREAGAWTVDPAYEGVGIPDNMTEMIELELHALPAVQREALEAASLVGLSFSAAAIAAALGSDIAAMEQTCEGVARDTPLLRRDGEAAWPDGTVTARYAFVHSLYREVLERAVPPARRAQLHLRVARRLEDAWQRRAADIAGDLAFHYERGGDAERAADRHEQAAEQALARQSPHEASIHLDTALALRERLPTSPERTQDVIRALGLRAAALTVAAGPTAPAVGETYERARALYTAGEETPQVVSVLGGLSTFHRLRGDLPRAIACGQETVDVARRLGGFPPLLGAAHVPLAAALLFAGDVRAAHTVGEAGLELFGEMDAMPFDTVIWLDPRIASLAQHAVTLTLVGLPREAARCVEEALAHARRSGHLATRLATLTYALLGARIRRDWPAVHALGGEALGLVRDPGLRVFTAIARAFRAHAQIDQGDAGGPAELEGAVAELAEVGAGVCRSHNLAMLGLAHARGGEREKALSLFDDAFAAAAASGERFAESELHRLHAATLSRPGRAPRGRRAVRDETAHAAEASLLRAVEVAREQGTRWLELRAGIDLARLWTTQDRPAEARPLLDAILDPYPGDLDLPDLVEARRLRGALGA